MEQDPILGIKELPLEFGRFDYLKMTRCPRGNFDSVALFIFPSLKHSVDEAFVLPTQLSWVQISVQLNQWPQTFRDSMLRDLMKLDESLTSESWLEGGGDQSNQPTKKEHIFSEFRFHPTKDFLRVFSYLTHVALSEGFNLL